MLGQNVGHWQFCRIWTLLLPAASVFYKHLMFFCAWSLAWPQNSIHLFHGSGALFWHDPWHGLKIVYIYFMVVEHFLAHLSQRLKWAIVIAHRPSSVRPSSVCPSVVRRPSVNFYIFNFFSRTAWWILMKLGKDEVLMVPYKCCCFSARSAQGRIQGGAKIGHGGSPSSRNFFFRPEGYSDKPNA